LLQKITVESSAITKTLLRYFVQS